MMSGYLKLERHFSQLHRLEHLGALCHWDQAVMMPAGSNEARADALAELALVVHERLTDPRLEGWLLQAEEEDLTPEQRANLREMHRRWQRALVVPPALVEAQSLAGSRCEHAWREQRRNNDWPGFAANLAEVVKLAREEAEIRGDALGTGAYEALLELYEPGMSLARLDALFDRMKGWLPELLERCLERQALLRPPQPKGPFPAASQRELGVRLMERLGFDFRRGRLDVSTHPFCGGVPEDVRLTSRYTEEGFIESLMGIVHETGHACYEQNLPSAWLAQPAGRARSMGIHESQSLLFEMQIARHPAFLDWLSPQLRQAFPQADAASLGSDKLRSLLQRVQPGLIRVDADEVTYPFHILLRFELERDLIEGRIEVADLPELWDLKMKAYLGLGTGNDYRNGCMQDIHWTDGGFGYFPTYTLGALAAAQFQGALERDLGPLDPHLASGNFRPLFEWLQSRVWQHGSLLDSDELMRQATGESLNPDWFRRHLERRYLSS